MRPFPRRHDISVKQAVYLRTIGEKLYKQELQRRAYDEKEQMVRAQACNLRPGFQIFRWRMWCSGDFRSYNLARVCTFSSVRSR